MTLRDVGFEASQQTSYEEFCTNKTLASWSLMCEKFTGNIQSCVYTYTYTCKVACSVNPELVMFRMSSNSCNGHFVYDSKSLSM